MTHVERKTLIVKLLLWFYKLHEIIISDYIDAYILVSRTIAITVTGADDAAKQLYERSEGVRFKNCAPFTDCTSEVNSTQIDNAKYICYCAIWLNIAIIIQKHQDVCGNIIEMIQTIT